MNAERDEPKSTRGKTGSTALESAATRAKVVELRLAGLALDDIASQVGLSGSLGGSLPPDQVDRE